ncbi:uncharacterized protein EV422DRAFT_394630 [Fimicolochytrium jonesii]|uniref:uncharacterized protein n=1 Tax=Fimicolochytrium jonesii TaxID=1396493 RepID=UPI0022FF062E|nr:uncharacterized protein EV422DRAFT_394630 [Fimicolochytrium jonesii]KAI8823174.1 hypothetical protein EV422DRAFT_394630 [Fimicolochytrium jonesii]
MESAADLIVASQLDLLDTAGSRRASTAQPANSIYRKPGPTVGRTPSQIDTLKLEGGGAHTDDLGDDEYDDHDGKEDGRRPLVWHGRADSECTQAEKSTDTLPGRKGSKTKPAKIDIAKSALLTPPSVSSASDVPTSADPPGFFKKNLGLLWMLLAACLFTIMSISVKAMTTSSSEVLPTLEIIFFRSVFVWLFGVGGMLYWEVGDVWLGPKGVRGLLFLRGVVGFMGLTCGWYALSLLTLADSTVLGFLSPVFTAILARLVLNEPYQLVDAITGTLSMVGVLFIARPPFLFGSTPTSTLDTPDDILAGGGGTDDISSSEIAAAEDMLSLTNTTSRILITSPAPAQSFLGIMVGLTGALIGASVFIIVRKLCGRATPLHIVSCLSLVSIPLSVLAGLVMPATTPWIVPRDPLTWMFLLVISGSAYGGQLCTTKSLQLESAGRAASMNYVQVIIAFVAEWIIWDKIPTMSSLIGGSIVGSSIVIITVSKLKKKK